MKSSFACLAHDSHVASLRFTSDDDPRDRCEILSEGRVQIRSLPQWKVMLQFPVDAKVLSAAAFLPSGQMLAVGAADRRIRAWNLEKTSLP